MYFYLVKEHEVKLNIFLVCSGVPYKVDGYLYPLLFSLWFIALWSLCSANDMELFMEIHSLYDF